MTTGCVSIFKFLLYFTKILALHLTGTTSNVSEPKTFFNLVIITRYLTPVQPNLQYSAIFRVLARAVMLPLACTMVHRPRSSFGMQGSSLPHARTYVTLQSVHLSLWICCVCSAPLATTNFFLIHSVGNCNIHLSFHLGPNYRSKCQSEHLYSFSQCLFSCQNVGCYRLLCLHCVHQSYD